MTLNARNLHPGDTATLDDIHALCVASYRPGWACDSPPHPSRNQLTRIAENKDRTIVVAEDEWGVAGWMAHAPDGLITGGMIRHGWKGGEGDRLDDIGLLILTALVNQIKANTGGRVFHVSWANPRMWYAMETQLGVPPHAPSWTMLGNVGAPPAPPTQPGTL